MQALGSEGAKLGRTIMKGLAGWEVDQVRWTRARIERMMDEGRSILRDTGWDLVHSTWDRRAMEWSCFENRLRSTLTFLTPQVQIVPGQTN